MNADVPLVPAFDPEAAGWTRRPPLAFSGLTGPLWQKQEGEGTAFGVLTGPQHANGQGMIHGGMLMTLLDNCLGLNVWVAGGRRPAVTMQLNTHFMAAALPGEFLEARAEIMRAAKSVVFVRGEVLVGDRRIATADGVWKILVPRADAGGGDPA